MKPLWVTDDAPAWTTWRELVRLVPADVSVVPQYVGRGESGDWYVSQGRDTGHTYEDLIITRFDATGTRRGTMRVPQGGHGDRMVIRGASDVGVYVQGVWCWLPWKTGATLTVSQAHIRADDRRRLQLAARTWCQGELDLGATWLRLYGVPFKPDGPSHNPQGKRNPDMPAFLEVIEGTKVARTVPLGHLARDADGRPLGGRLEPEGLALTTIDGRQVVLVGFAIGPIGQTTMIVYGLPLDEIL